MHDMTILQALGVWDELRDALDGESSYGGHVAEIYAYRLQKYRPSAHNSPPVGGEAKPGSLCHSACMEAALEAGQNLAFLISEFKKRHECDVSIEGSTRDDAEAISVLDKVGFSHRTHVRVTPKGGAR